MTREPSATCLITNQWGTRYRPPVYNKKGGGFIVTNVLFSSTKPLAKFLVDHIKIKKNKKNIYI